MPERIASLNDPAQRPTIVGVGSHSMLDKAEGATAEGLESIAVCKRGREAVYMDHLKGKDEVLDIEMGVINRVWTVDDWKDLANPEMLLLGPNPVFVPDRSAEVYLGYEILESLPIHILGNRRLLRAEERSGKWKPEKNQDYLLKEAGIPVPRKYGAPEEIDGPAIVKMTAGKGERHFERRFIMVSSYEEFKRETGKLVAAEKTTPEQVASASIEEFVGDLATGTKAPCFNFNYFASPLTGRIELLSIDTRTQATNGEELAHHPASLRESLLDKARTYGHKFVAACREHYAPGIIGPFALQTIWKGETPLVYDASLRIPGSPDPSIYSGYLFRKPMSFGRRIALEVRRAWELGRLAEVVT